MSDNSKNPAFPTDYQLSFHGLTKREYFAGLAMQGAIATYGESGLPVDIVAEYSVRMADQLLKQLES